MSNDCYVAQPLISVDEARKKLLAMASPHRGFEWVSLNDAAGRVLAQTVISPVDLPAFNNSAMDGYALRSQDLALPDFRVVDRVLAGYDRSVRIGAGEAVRIMTGARMPEGADTVVMQEQTRCVGDHLHLLKAVLPGANVRRRGEEIAVGQKVFRPGALLGAAQCALLAAMGIDEVEVYRRPVVALFSTGDELVEPGVVCLGGQIYDSNRHLLMAMLRQIGAVVVDLGIIPDDRRLLRSALLEGGWMGDLVISSGGVSVGEADHMRSLMARLGEIEQCKLALKPGKPLTFGKIGGALYLGLPGNPVSAAVTMELFGVPLLRVLGGLKPFSEPLFMARSAVSLHKKSGRREYRPAWIEYGDDGQWQVTPVRHQGSAMLSALTGANGFIILEEETTSVSAGSMVTVQRFSDALRS